MKIIYVTANLPYGAHEAFVVSEIDELTRMGHQILLVPRSPKGRVVHAAGLVRLAQAEGLFSPRVLRSAARLAFTEPRLTLSACCPLFRSRSIGLCFKNLAVVPKAFWLAGLARRWQADHIHCHWAGTTATMALLAGKLTGIPWSFTAHRWDVVENNLLATKTKSASFVRFISRDGLLMAAEMGIPLGENIRVLPMGVQIPDRSQWNPPQPAVVLCPANLVEIKGHRFLIESWRILRDRGVHGQLWLAGGGELRKRLEALVRNLGVSDSIRFLGVVPHEALLKLYETNIVSLVALASIDMGNGSREGVPVALMEAMTYGIPVIATKTGGIPELVLPGTGLLVPPADPAALADALQSVLQDPRRWEQLGRSARQRAMEAHDIRRIAFALQSAFACTSRNAPCSDRPRPNTAVEPGIRVTPVNRTTTSLPRRIVQPCVERIAAAAALVLCSPLLLLIAVCIALESGWPVLFRQIRVGQRGQAYTLIKFRSMRTGMPGSGITAHGDPRVTGVGAILRKYKLDELPQLWNILLGHMQFIGPRPELPPFVDPADPLWRAVLSEKPGLTDLSTLVYRNEEEVLSRSADPDRTYRERVLPEKLRLSAYYSRTRNLFSDCKLLLLTLRYSFLPGGFDASRIQRIFVRSTQ